MMLSFEEARAIAERMLIDDEEYDDENDRIVIPEKSIVEIPHAWIFHYTTKGALAGNIMYALGGNSPLFLDKKDGRVSRYPTSLSTERMIHAYEEENKCWQLRLTTDVYASAQKMMVLKNCMQLTQAALIKLKANKAQVLDSGANSRLEEMAGVLIKEGIACEVTLVPI